MPDALTESFCERCGTRYEFAAPARLNSIRRTRGVFAGLKNYILGQDSLGDSLDDAIRQEEEVLAVRQLDAFHASFSFCIDCRQYTCTNCWNDAVGRCQSCQPLPEAELNAERLAATLGELQPVLAMPFPLGDQAAWPALDLTEPEPEPVLAEVEPEPEPEPVLAEVEPEPEPEPVPYRRLKPISDTFLHLPQAPPESGEAAAAAAMDDESMAARRAQFDVLGLGDPGAGPVEPDRPVVLPYRSSGAAPHPTDRQAAVAGGASGGAFWDASAREVAGAISQIGVRTCAHCELSLSATARFCRRCGTPQAQSA
jgi:hypothetical protein